MLKHWPNKRLLGTDRQSPRVQTKGELWQVKRDRPPVSSCWRMGRLIGIKLKQASIRFQHPKQHFLNGLRVERFVANRRDPGFVDIAEAGFVFFAGHHQDRYDGIA